MCAPPASFQAGGPYSGARGRNAYQRPSRNRQRANAGWAARIVSPADDDPLELKQRVLADVKGIELFDTDADAVVLEWRTSCFKVRACRLQVDLLKRRNATCVA